MASCKGENRSASATRRWSRSTRLRAYTIAAVALAVSALYGIATSQTAALSRAVELVSVSIFGSSGNNTSNGPAVNSDGTFVGFWSDATNLVPNDRTPFRDVYLRNRGQQTTQRVNLSGDGDAANAPSEAQGGAPAVNGSGSLIAFYSSATNLVPDDTNGQTDVFVRAVDTGTTTLVSVSSSGVQGNGPSLFPSVSADGRFVAFQSSATNLVAEGGTGQFDIYVRDLANNTTERICASIHGNGSNITPAISGDGSMVAFASNATNLVPNDTNNDSDVFVCNRSTGAIEVVSVNDMGVLGNGDSILPAINFDGSVVAFKSTASNLVPNDHNGVVDVFARDRAAMKTERISVSDTGGDADDGSFPPSVDYSGRFVAFGSSANNLVPGDFNAVSDVFVRDRMQNLTLQVDVNERGEQANNGTLDVPPSVSGDARQIGFVSQASNLAANDNTNIPDVFITRNPFACDTDADCPQGLVCEDGFCVVRGTPTPTATAGPNDCCQCAGPACQDPTDQGCPADCDIVRNASCPDNVSCTTFTPTSTPTATPTAGPNDCCQCEGPSCQDPTDQGCPVDCEIVRNAACPDNVNCITFTPTSTATATPTAGPNDCCQCPNDMCEAPGTDGCPSTCEIVRDALCFQGVMCQTFTPAPTVTPTPTAGPNDCCQCTASRCEAAGNDGCPPECDIVRDAVCLNDTSCATITPTRTPTRSPTPTPTGGTPTLSPTTVISATATRTATQGATVTPTGTGGGTPTATPVGRDKEGGCNCTIASDSPGAPLSAPTWLAGPVALLIWRRRASRRAQR
jgi:hypothetical protein